MNDDMPWVDLTPEEVQELRTNKQQLTEYGKQKIRELMNHEEMLEIAAQREAANKAALESLGIDYESFGQKPWDESMLEETSNEAIIVKVSEEDYQKVMDAAKEKKVLEIAKNFIEEHSDAMKQLAKIEHQELAAELALELRSWAQNEEMIDQYFTNHGRVCNQAADLLELLANETMD